MTSYTSQHQRSQPKDNSFYIKKQPQEVLYEKSYSKKFIESHRKTSVLESNLNPETKASNFIEKEIPRKVFSCESCEIMKDIYFIVHLWTTASEHYDSAHLKSLEYSIPYSSAFQLQKKHSLKQQSQKQYIWGIF